MFMLLSRNHGRNVAVYVYIFFS
jgi:hypothetical protein